MGKVAALAELKEDLAKDESLPFMEANLVFGEGNPDTMIMFIGEAPGFYEDREGRPFVGQAGKLLDKLISSINWLRSEVYITNIIKRRPPQNRDPLPDEIAAYEPYLRKQIEIIDPKIIIPLGRFSMNYFLPEAKISRDQGQIFWRGDKAFSRIENVRPVTSPARRSDLEDKLIYPLYHPAAALRSTTVLGELQKSFLKIPWLVKNFETLVKGKNGSTVEETIDKDGESETKQQRLL